MNINIGGVPEHFNLPWHLANEESVFTDVTINWQDIPEGTGAMARLLDSGELDMALLLTEGAVNAIDKGGDFKVYDFYVRSPLVWGIHVGAKSGIRSIDELNGQTYAISRFGSGSHLMAFVDADKRGWDTQKLKFEVINTLDGAVGALTEGRADTFFWEKFTTKFLVDDGTFRRVGERPTPWPCFVLAINNTYYAKNESLMENFWCRMKEHVFKISQRENLLTTVASRYNQHIEDVKAWREITEWNTRKERMTKEDLELPIAYLKKLQLIGSKKTADQYLF